MSSSTLQPEQRKQIEQLLNTSTNNLYSQLGAELRDSIMRGVGPEHKSALIALARDWVKRNMVQLQTSICSSPGVQDFINSPSTSRRVEIVAIIADIVAQTWVGIPPFTLSALLVQEGLSELCDE
jgi:hypothetical protein